MKIKDHFLFENLAFYNYDSTVYDALWYLFRSYINEIEDLLEKHSEGNIDFALHYFTRKNITPETVCRAAALDIIYSNNIWTDYFYELVYEAFKKDSDQGEFKECVDRRFGDPQAEMPPREQIVYLLIRYRLNKLPSKFLLNQGVS